MARRPSIIRFGWNGWYDRYDDAFTEQNVVRVADALGLMWADSERGSVAFVGYDTRHAASDLAMDCAAAISSYGIEVVVSEGPCPTPVVGWSCAQCPDVVGGLVVTASERSCEYGGLIVRGPDGGPVSQTFLDMLERNVSLYPRYTAGTIRRADLVGPYLDDIVRWVDVLAIRAAAPKVVADPMHGAGTSCLGEILRRVGCDVVELHAEPREDLGGIHPDPRDSWCDACAEVVTSCGADLGVLVDGDADRSGLVDETGQVLAPRTLVPLVMGQLAEGHGLRGRVITTLSCSDGIRRQAERLGLECLAVPVGFARAYREMLEGDVLMAAEEYGGVSVADHLLERDGILTMLLAVELVAKSGRTASQLVSELEQAIGPTRYTRRDVMLDPAITQAFRLVLPGLNPAEVAGRRPVDVSHADGLRLQFEDDSWVLIRPSRAGAAVRVYAEAATETQRDELLEGACELVRRGI